MKILILDHYYPAFITDFYKKNPEINCKSYKDQKKSILDMSFGTADFYSKNLTQLGYKAVEIIINNEILQKRWAKENNISFFNGYFQSIPKLKNIFKTNWNEKILEAQIKIFSPDIIYCQNLSYPSQNFLKKIKKNVKLIIGQAACPINFDKKKLAAFDLILTSFPHFVEKFKKIGINSQYFKIGFEKSIIDKLKKTEKQYDAVFIGGISKHHLEFIDILEFLAKNIKIDFWGYGFEKLDKDSPILKNYHGKIWGIDMYNILYNSKISINRHIDAAENFANNMRIYESTGVGAMLITDYKKNIGDLFKAGEEIETYKTKTELIEKIKYYLADERARKKIAEAGQRRVLKNHTYEHRMRELISIITEYSSY
ncbi:MAG: glycosyltransferase [bacterium]